MYSMYSERASIGVINPLGPCTNHALNRFAPKGVSFAVTGLKFDGPTPEGLVALADQVEEAAKMFSKKKDNYNVVLFGCTSGSLIKGYGFDKEMIEIIERVSGRKGLTTTTAVLEAFEALGAKKTVVMTPYPDDTNQIEKKFLEDNGIEVLSITGVPLRGGQGEFCHASREFLYRHAKRLKMEGADCFFMSCMGLYTMEFINIMEEDFGLPVITSQQATLWACLRHSGINDKMPHLGKLFTL